MTFWTDERVSRLKQLWADGHSAGEIAATFRETTRNAVIGKIHRLGLSNRGPRYRSTAPKPARKVAVKHQERAPMVVAPKPAIAPVRLPKGHDEPNHGGTLYLSAEHYQCKHIAGDPRSVPIDQLMVCGKPRKSGSSYCPEHHARVFVTPPKAERVRA